MLLNFGWVLMWAIFQTMLFFLDCASMVGYCTNHSDSLKWGDSAWTPDCREDVFLGHGGCSCRSTNLEVVACYKFWLNEILWYNILKFMFWKKWFLCVAVSDGFFHVPLLWTFLMVFAANIWEVVLWGIVELFDLLFVRRATEHILVTFSSFISSQWGASRNRRRWRVEAFHHYASDLTYYRLKLKMGQCALRESLSFSHTYLLACIKTSLGNLLFLLLCNSWVKTQWQTQVYSKVWSPLGSLHRRVLWQNPPLQDKEGCPHCFWPSPQAREVTDTLFFHLENEIKHN